MNNNSSSTTEAMISQLTAAAQADGNVDAAVIWLHGLGADGNDFVPLLPALPLCAQLRIRFVFPHAPIRPVTINNGIRMRAWYDIHSIDLTGTRDLDQAGMSDSAKIVNALIQQQTETGIPANRIILAGFSQGGVIALRSGLAHTPTLAGVIALSCYLPLNSSQQLIDWQNLHTNLPPVFLAHGQYDPVVPFNLGQQAARQLQGADWPLTWRDYPVQHGLHPDEVVAIDQWLAEQLTVK